MVHQPWQNLSMMCTNDHPPLAMLYISDLLIPLPLTSDYDLTLVIASALNLLETGGPQCIWTFTADEIISKDKILPLLKLILKFQ